MYKVKFSESRRKKNHEVIKTVVYDRNINQSVVLRQSLVKHDATETEETRERCWRLWGGGGDEDAEAGEG